MKYTEVNIWKDPAAAAFVRSVADGNETVPTVTVAGRHGEPVEATVWSGQRRPTAEALEPSTSAQAGP